MTMCIRLAALAASLVLVSAFCCIPCVAQVDATGLLDRKIELHIEDGTFLLALSKLAVEKRVPIGFEAVAAERFERRVDIAVNDAKLKDVLDAIVRQAPAYRWELRDGVINILPAGSRDEFIVNLLGTPVGRFEPAKGIGKFRLRDAVLDLPQVQSFLKANGVTARRDAYYYRPSIYSNKEVDLSIFNTDVRGVLNRIVRESEHKMWSIGRSGEKSEFLEIGL